jgi:hypothetical protein
MTATPACIRRIHAELIRSSEREIEKRFLDADGMTDIISADRLPSTFHACKTPRV